MEIRTPLRWPVLRYAFAVHTLPRSLIFGAFSSVWRAYTASDLLVYPRAAVRLFFEKLPENFCSVVAFSQGNDLTNIVFIPLLVFRKDVLAEVSGSRRAGSGGASSFRVSVFAKDSAICLFGAACVPWPRNFDFRRRQCHFTSLAQPEPRQGLTLYPPTLRLYNFAVSRPIDATATSRSSHLRS